MSTLRQDLEALANKLAMRGIETHGGMSKAYTDSAGCIRDLLAAHPEEPESRDCLETEFGWLKGLRQRFLDSGAILSPLIGEFENRIKVIEIILNIKHFTS